MIGLSLRLLEDAIGADSLADDSVFCIPLLPGDLDTDRFPALRLELWR